MECCNKEEAIKAKSMAEIRMKANDFSGAAKFAWMSQKLDPKIDGVSKMVSIIDVYLSAERRICGEVDWYGILRVDPTADDEAIKKQYKRLALEIHPDKNSTAGAAGAFKLVSEAKCLLLDKAQRTVYDRIAGYQPIPIPTQDIGLQANADVQFEDLHDFVFSHKRTKVEGKTVKKASQTRQMSDLFWTVCYRCRLQLQYRIMFRNIVIRCLSCENTFVAMEVPWPIGRSRSHKPKPWPPRREEGLKRRREWEDASAKTGYQQPGVFPPPFVAGNASGVSYQQPGMAFGRDNFVAGNSFGVFNNFEGANTSGASFWTSTGMQQGTSNGNRVNPSEAGKEAEMEGWGMEEGNRVVGDETVKNFYSCW